MIVWCGAGAGFFTAGRCFAVAGQTVRPAQGSSADGDSVPYGPSGPTDKESDGDSAPYGPSGTTDLKSDGDSVPHRPIGPTGPTGPTGNGIPAGTTGHSLSARSDEDSVSSTHGDIYNCLHKQSYWPASPLQPTIVDPDPHVGTPNIECPQTWPPQPTPPTSMREPIEAPQRTTWANS